MRRWWYELWFRYHELRIARLETLIDYHDLKIDNIERKW